MTNDLTALADLIDDAAGIEVCTYDPMRCEHKRTYLSGDDIARLGTGLAALRAAAVQGEPDQKPVAKIECPNCHDANKYGDYEGPACGVCLGDGFVSPPPAVGWDDAITELTYACDLLKETKQGSPARSPGHNARLVIEKLIEALRHNAPPDTGAGKSAPPCLSPLPSGEVDPVVMPDHGGADAGVGETLTLDDALEDLHDLLVAGATGEDIKIFAAEHPQFSDQIFAFTEAWFSAGESDE